MERLQKKQGSGALTAGEQNELNMYVAKVQEYENAHSKEKDKEVILLRFYKNKTQTQVSKILGISQVQVSRTERKILDNMKKALI